MSSKNLITLKTSDDDKFKLDQSIVMRSQVIKNIVQYVDCTSNVIHLTNVDGKIMYKVVEYWKKHSEEAADFPNNKEMMDVMCQDVFDRIKEKLITFKTSDGEDFKLEEVIVVRSEVIKNIVQDVDCTSNVIPLLNVDEKTMKTIIKYWEKHSEEGVMKDQLKNFD
uniref:SKP1 component POZ domain-containing protein n=1 Tax=Solanum lycopersicum TaxID=4081 RepID=A0A3Q7EC91_SOLLC